MSINKIFGKFFNELEFKRFLIEISYILIVLPAFFLLVNMYSYLLIIAVFISVLTGFIFFARRRAISGLHAEPLFIVLLLFIYFILSFFVTGHNLKDFFSYQFLRNDGNFFFCYILFFVFPTISLDYKKTAGYFFKFLFSIFTVFYILGILSYFTGGLGFLSQFEGEWMYFALNN